MAKVPAENRIQAQLLQWFRKNGRDLPWRRTRDPYAIWVSEIMLQQTQVDTVIPYYQRFLKSFPTVRRLAKADLSKVLKAWEGLGYYSRARNLHRASQVLSSHLKGKIPDTMEGLLNIPGIGRYTAGAILSIAYNKEAPILDGNVKRVLARLFAVSGDIRKKETERTLWALSESLIPEGHAGSFNQALMDLGAMVCTPRGPLCLRCPLQRLCKARAQGKPERYPLKAAKKRIPRVDALSAVIERNGKVLVRQRPAEGLLGGLWEFPNWKIENCNHLKKSLKVHLKKELGVVAKVGDPIGTFQQTYSHFKLTLHVYRCHILSGKNYGTWVPARNLDLFPMSRLHRTIAQHIGEKFQKMGSANGMFK